MCRPLNSSLPSRQLFQQEDMTTMHHKMSSSSLSMPPSLVSPPPTMAPLSLPPIRPAPRPCKMVEITEAIMLPSITMDMDECDDEELRMMRPRFTQYDYDME